MRIAELGGADGARAHAAPLAWREVTELDQDWQAACAPAGQFEHPGQIAALEWLPAIVPGTAASALRAAGRWQPGEVRDFDGEDWWFRTRFAAAPARPRERLTLSFGGLATVAAVYLNGEQVLWSESMFAGHAVDVTALVRPDNELVIHCMALAPLLAANRRPRARWRTRLVSDRNLRFFRTMILGRAPGFAPSPAAVGPYMPVRLERVVGPALDALRLRSRLTGGGGTVTVHARVHAPDERPDVHAAELRLRRAGEPEYRTALEVHRAGDGIELAGALTVADPTPWWPHTHGVPALYDAELHLRHESGTITLPAGRVGFRRLENAGDPAIEGLALRINDVPIFARGAVWTPRDPAAPHAAEGEIRRALEAVVAAGMNMVRVPGVGCYESDAFYDLCDELGVLVWQDFMFANLDYPDADPDFMRAVAAEAAEVLDRLAPRPSLAVLCGGSEVAQQAAMLGLDPLAAMRPVYLELLPRAQAEAGSDAVYIPSAPWGGDVPFRPSVGVANYYGVGAYLRPLEDARRAGVRFAAECLAFANIPDDEALPDSAGPVIHHPEWKRGVPRDVGAGWDFEDVRDHYLRLLFELDPVALRSRDPERYLELSRQVSGEVMAEVMGEWRRRDSPCAGGLVLWLGDLQPGAGWGVLDHRGAPKVAYHHLRRALAPVAVWSTDEGLDGIVAHVANDGPEPLTATLRAALYRDRETPVEAVARELELAPHSVVAHNVEALLGHFADISWSYRFGPPAQDLVVLTLEDRRGPETRVLSQAFRHPAGRPASREPAGALGLTAEIRDDGEAATVRIAARRFAYGVRIHLPGHVAEDDAFGIEPGHARTLRLHRLPHAADAQPSGHVTALNLTGRVAITRV